MYPHSLSFPLFSSIYFTIFASHPHLQTINTPFPLLSHSLPLYLRLLFGCLLDERGEKENSLEHDSGSLIGKESTRNLETWESSEGVSGYEKLLSPLRETVKMAKKKKQTVTNAHRQGRGEKAVFPRSTFKEVILIKSVVMKILRAW